MNTTTYRTVVSWLPPTPLGLLPGRWAVTHHCVTCRRRVDANDLVAHADEHTVALNREDDELVP